MCHHQTMGQEGYPLPTMAKEEVPKVETKVGGSKQEEAPKEETKVEAQKKKPKVKESSRKKQSRKNHESCSPE